MLLYWIAWLCFLKCCHTYKKNVFVGWADEKLPKSRVNGVACMQSSCQPYNHLYLRITLDIHCLYQTEQHIHTGWFEANTGGRTGCLLTAAGDQAVDQYEKKVASCSGCLLLYLNQSFFETWINCYTTNVSSFVKFQPFNPLSNTKQESLAE